MKEDTFVVALPPDASDEVVVKSRRWFHDRGMEASVFYLRSPGGHSIPCLEFLGKGNKAIVKQFALILKTLR
jgi:hypothetical protein